MKLVELSIDLKPAFLKLVEDYRLNDLDQFEKKYKRARNWDDEEFAAYLEELDRWKKGVGLKPNQIPTTSYYMIGADGGIGSLGILRFPLDARCAREGGNIGYETPPSQRGKGYATDFLRLCLVKARGAGLGRVLLTCNKENHASARVIEKCGGHLHGYVESVEKGNEGNLVAHFWFNL